jgi:hypothetical protein
MASHGHGHCCRQAGSCWGTSPCSGLHVRCRLEAWRQEFWPSVAADAVLGIVNGGVKRAGWLPLLHQRRAYLTAVPQVVLAPQRCCTHWPYNLVTEVQGCRQAAQLMLGAGCDA